MKAEQVIIITLSCVYSNLQQKQRKEDTRDTRNREKVASDRVGQSMDVEVLLLLTNSIAHPLLAANVYNIHDPHGINSHLTNKTFYTWAAVSSAPGFYPPTFNTCY